MPSILSPLLPGGDKRLMPLPQPGGALAQPMTFELVGGGKLLATGSITPGISQSFAAEVGRHGDYIKTVVLDRPRPATAGAAAADRALPPGEALGILCVEHNPYGRVVMNAIVTGLGHRASFAGSAEAALAALAAGSPDVVLMDVALPGIDGYEATRRIRALPGRAGRVAVIGVCGQGDPAKDRKSTRLNSSHRSLSRMPSSA